jgi:hypothetical protein
MIENCPLRMANKANMKLILGLLLCSQMLTSWQLFSMPEVQWQHVYPNPAANGLSAVT